MPDQSNPTNETKEFALAIAGLKPESRETRIDPTPNRQSIGIRLLHGQKREGVAALPNGYQVGVYRLGTADPGERDTHTHTHTQRDRERMMCRKTREINYMSISLQTGNNFRVVKYHLACLNDDLENDRSVKGLYLISLRNSTPSPKTSLHHHPSSSPPYPAEKNPSFPNNRTNELKAF